MMTSRTTPVSQHHAIFLQRMKDAAGVTIPALYFSSNKGPVLADALVDYFLAHPNRSITWNRNTARALGLFWDYCVATNGQSSVWGTGNVHRRVFRKFSLSLLRGTIDPTSHLDNTGLYWPPSSFNVAKRLTAALTEFIAWCHDEGIIDSSIVKKNVIPMCEASTIAFLHTAIKIKRFSFLSHLKSGKDIAARLHSRQKAQIMDLGHDPSPATRDQEAKYFPPNLVAPLLQHGFVLSDDPAAPLEDREDITAKMITLILLFGGTRISEPFHMWFNDVVPQADGTCKAFLRHPAGANTCLGGKDNKSRRDYLLERNLIPRNDSGATKSYKAGWKYLKVDSSLAAPIFFIHVGAEHLFREMYLYYLRYRSRLLKIRSDRGLADHPFLFVSRGVDETSGKNYSGEPYSIAAYKKALERALVRTEKKLGIKIPRGKMAGTTPHGFRHWYGAALSDNGMDTKVIQNCLRHRSPLSQGTYTAPTHSKVMRELDSARNKITTESGELFSNLSFLNSEPA